MRNISLRKFRDEIIELHESVEVSRRGNDGNIQILGYWTPYLQDPTGPEPVPPSEDGELHATVDVVRGNGSPRVIKTAADIDLATIKAIHPVPKPSQKRSRA